ncbi:hypothetical protein T09_9125 [Trichinella sp. T9]|nr:hypothetical protein T09_9125 [Trichinella sp. T9]
MKNDNNNNNNSPNVPCGFGIVGSKVNVDLLPVVSNWPFAMAVEKFYLRGLIFKQSLRLRTFRNPIQLMNDAQQLGSMPTAAKGYQAKAGCQQAAKMA